MVEEQKKQIETLNNSIKELNASNLILETKISKFDKEIEQVDKSIGLIKNQKTIIKEFYHEKISNIDKFTLDEIDSFFTNRYK